MPRILHRFYAFTFGYFWMPCPLCGRSFGGHENPKGSIPVGQSGLNRCICPTCTAAVQ